MYDKEIITVDSNKYSKKPVVDVLSSANMDKVNSMTLGVIGASNIKTDFGLSINVLADDPSSNFGVYFTTWEWPYNDYTIGEFTFWDSNDFNSSGVYLSTVANPASQYFGCFCPDTDATGNLSTLKLFIDFGLGSPYYQNVYYAAGDNGF